jgi:peptidyl-prolyl cis-trans isomerase C
MEVNMTDKIKAQHILVEHEYEANDLIKKLDDGEEFDALAKDFSKCPSGQNGGHLGEFGKGMMVKEFETASFALEVGEVSAPVQTQFGYHIIKRV